MNLLFSIFIFAYVIISAPILYFTALVIFIFTYPFDKRRIILHKFSIVWGLLYFWVSPGWRIRFSGKENCKKGKTYIVVSNHQAMLDIGLMYKLPNSFRWVSKREVLKIPFIGWLMPLHGDVLIKRGSATSAKAMIKECKTWLDRKVSIAVFPEGTRAKDGRVHDFKEGAFLMAKMNKIAILPVVMNGTYEATAENGLNVSCRQNFDFHILPEISEEEVSSISVKDMTRKVQGIIAEAHRKVAPQLYE